MWPFPTQKGAGEREREPFLTNSKLTCFQEKGISLSTIIAPLPGSYQGGRGKGAIISRGKGDSVIILFPKKRAEKKKKGLCTLSRKKSPHYSSN